MNIGSRAASLLLRWSIERPRAVFAFWGLVGIAATIGLLSLEIDTSTNSILDRHGADWDTYQQSLTLFGGDEVITIALRGQAPYEPGLLGKVRQLSARLEEIPGVRRVDSLSTVPIVRSDSDGALDLSPALGPRVNDIGSPEWIAEVRDDRLAPNFLVSEEGTTIAVNVYLEESAASNPEPLVHAVRHAVTDLPAWVSGVPTFRIDANIAIAEETLAFVPLTLLLIAVLLWLVFRDVRAVAVPLVTAGIGTLVVVGLMGAAGIPLSMSTMILPTILLALGCAYVMHLLTAITSRSHSRPLLEALEPLAAPIALSGATTAIGFAAMAVVEIDAIREVGLLGAVGVLIVLAATLSVAPAMLKCSPPRVRPVWIERFRRQGSRRVGRAATRHAGYVVLAWAAVTLAVGSSALLLRVETDVTRWFEPGTRPRDDYESIRRELAGITPMNVMVSAVDGKPLSDPALLDRIDALSAFIRAQHNVGKVVSVADPLRQLHGGFVGDASRPLPEDHELVEQYLLMLESLPQLDDFITPDRMHANIAMRLDNNGSRYLLDLSNRIEDWWRKHGSDEARVRTTGIMFQFARSTDEVAWGQIRGLAIALTAIGAILLAVLRRPTLALVALLPNALPVLLAFGAMGALGIALDASTVFVGSLALGIAVDDTLHLVTALYRQQRGTGSVELVLERALSRVLPALCFTTAVVVVGFAIMGLSRLTVIQNLGLVTGGILILCLLADLSLLPAAIALGGRRSRSVESPPPGAPRGR